MSDREPRKYQGDDENKSIAAQEGLLVDVGKTSKYDIQGKRRDLEETSNGAPASLPERRQASFRFGRFVRGILHLQRHDSSASSVAAPPPIRRQTSTPGAFHVFPGSTSPDSSNHRQTRSVNNNIRARDSDDCSSSDASGTYPSLTRVTTVQSSSSDSEQPSLVTATLVARGDSNNYDSTTRRANVADPNNESMGLSSTSILTVEALPAQSDFWIVASSRRMRCLVTILFLLFCGMLAGMLSSIRKNRESIRRGSGGSKVQDPNHQIPPNHEDATTSGPTSASAPTLSPVAATAQESYPVSTAAPSFTMVEDMITSALTVKPTLSPMTTEPSNAPPPKKEDVILDTIFAAISLDSLEALEVFESPQASAVRWLMEDSLLHKLIDSNQTRRNRRFLEEEVGVSSRILQRYALATTYFATGGPSWTESGGWLSSDHECTWFSAIQDVASTSVCDGDTLLHLSLSKNGLVGTIPADASLLHNLVTIDLCENEISGTILPYLERMHSLEYIKLDQNEFVGTLPIALGNLSSLQRMTLGSNSFHGSLPSDWSRLASLTTLHVEDNPNLWGTVPSTYSSLESLEDFWIYGTSVVGLIPQGVCNLKDTGALKSPKVECLRTACHCCDCMDVIFETVEESPSNPTTPSPPTTSPVNADNVIDDGQKEADDNSDDESDEDDSYD